MILDGQQICVKQHFYKGKLGDHDFFPFGSVTSVLVDLPFCLPEQNKDEVRWGKYDKYEWAKSVKTCLNKHNLIYVANLKKISHWVSNQYLLGLD